MRKCNNCNIEYEDTVNYCRKCGAKLAKNSTDKKEKPKNNVANQRRSNNVTFIRYAVGALLVFVGFNSFSDGLSIALLFIMLGLSITPLLDKLLNKVIKKFYDENRKLCIVSIPIIIFIALAAMMPTEKLEYIKINDDGITLSVGEEHKIDFETNLKETKISDFEFEVSDPSLIMLSKGVITGLKEGNVTITIKGANSISATVNYTIKKVEIESLSFSSSEYTIGKGNTAELKLNIVPANATSKEITWTSDNNDIVSVDDGKITGKAEGTAIVTARSSNGVEASIKVLVRRYKYYINYNETGENGQIREYEGYAAIFYYFPSGRYIITATSKSDNMCWLWVDENEGYSTRYGTQYNMVEKLTFTKKGDIQTVTIGENVHIYSSNNCNYELQRLY